MSTLYKIQELKEGSNEWITIDSFTNKVRAKFYLKEYQAYKPTNQFRIV